MLERIKEIFREVNGEYVCMGLIGVAGTAFGFQIAKGYGWMGEGTVKEAVGLCIGIVTVVVVVVGDAWDETRLSL